MILEKDLVMWELVSDKSFLGFMSFTTYIPCKCVPI
jgi:hypothetical protein